ncbi:MAG: SPOR domain-containing protein [Alphaproteobacteria bacterium]|nr:SPOR domain-containing protein [Alphaproteobacteria bacterium]
MVKRIITVITLTLAFALPAAAQDFEQGLAAQKRGDYAAALRMWRPLAERGHAAAQNGVGLLYDNGQGVTQDHDRALVWYRKAARQGHADAQYNLGLMYANGLAVGQDYYAAMTWYRKAARQGHREAKVNLDVLYLMGHVTPKPGGSGQAQAQRAPAVTVTGKTAQAPATIAAKSRESGEQTAMGAAPAAESTSGRVEAELAAEAAAALSRETARDVAAVVEPAKPSGVRPVVKTPAAPAPAEVATPAGSETQPPAPGGDFRVQLSSVKTKLRAMKEASRLKQAHESLLGPLEIEPVRADLGDRGVFYRLRAGPISDASSARSLCRELSSRNQGCIVVKK